jgi:uncharacterized phage protein (TIGR02218 family)
MQTLPTALADHLTNETTTLATCWSIARRDGVTLYFTEHDQDILVDGELYVATSGMSASAITSQAGLSVDNLELEGILSSAAINEEDILAGRYDHAEISVFMVNYTNPADGKLHLKTGWLGEVTLRNQQFTAEVRGLTSRLQQVIGEVYTKTCRARFCDARCGLNITSFTVTGNVTASDSAYAFTDSARTESGDYFAYGVVTFTSGDNAGLSMEIRDYGAGRFSLFLPLPQPILVGDAYSATAGCDKTFETCLGRFNNVINFRGEPHVPGTDKLLETSATRSS